MNSYKLVVRIFLLFASLLCCSTLVLGQFNLSTLNVGSLSLGNLTYLKFGPDNRLYVSQQNGTIYAFTIQRNGPNSYSVTSTETINLVKNIPNYNDNGTAAPGTTSRQVTGLWVVGTATNPVVYVSSSDFRIGGPTGDLGLDTNSGMITRLTWIGANAPSQTNFAQVTNAQVWDKVDIVRGLPRSEENHANNGLATFTKDGRTYLLVALGGSTNAGGPSQNFTKKTEFALSAAVLSIDLTAIEAMPIQGSGVNKFIYDLPTVDDPNRANVNGITDPNAPGYNGIDVGDPFGGNDGLNQAKIVPGGPVQIFSPGYRNAYDLVITQEGRVYVTDNGANGGWGGLPQNEGPPTLVNGQLVSNVTNNYHIDANGNELGSTSSFPFNGQFVNNKDHLHLITGIGAAASNNIQNYTFGSYYAGHPTPIRANPAGAGLFVQFGTNTSNDGLFRTVKFNPNGTGDEANPSKALPADWPPVPVSMANPVEGDFRNPGEGDGALLTWGNNSNAIAEYTASNLSGAYKGNLMIGTSNGGGKVFRLQLNPDGTSKSLNTGFATTGQGYVLGLDCQGDNEIFPGTIWVASYNKAVQVLEPSDYGGGVAPVCLSPVDPGYDPQADYDGDGYKNFDEIANEVDHCSGAQKPADFDGDLVSDLNDTDDDNDGIADHLDVFQRSALNGLNNNVPINLSLFNSEGSGFYQLGLTGMMANLQSGDNYLNWLDDPNLTEYDVDDLYGGAPGVVTVYVEEGTAKGSTNTQTKGFQFGLNVSSTTPAFFTRVSMLKPFHVPSAGQEYGIFIGTGDQDNYIQLVRTVSGIEVGVEIGGVYKSDIFAFNVPVNVMDLYFYVDPAAGTVHPAYAVDEGQIVRLGSPIAVQGAFLQALQQSGKAIAVGMIGTNNGQPEFAANYDFFEANWQFSNGTPTFVKRIRSGPTTLANFTDSQGNVWEKDNSIVLGSAYPGPSSAAAATIAARDILNTIEDPLYRFERGGSSGFEYAIAVPENGIYTVKLHFAEIFFNVVVTTGGVGSRVFNVSLEGQPVLTNYDIIQKTGAAATAVIETFQVNVNDGILNIKGTNVVGQAKISGIEILKYSDAVAPIAVNNIADQQSLEGAEANLLVVASGGEGNLTYSATGLPAGVMIEPTNGHIHGTIAAGTATGGPANNGVYSVTVTVDDEGGASPATKSFTWTVTVPSTIPNVWTAVTTTNSHISRHENSFVQLGDKFYVLGGRESNTIEEYDYNTKTWTPGPAAPVALNHFQAIEYQGLLWVLSSFKDNTFPVEQPTENIYMYNPVTKQWITGPEIPVARRRGSAGVVLHNNKFYIFSGITNGHTNGWVTWVDEYDPATNTWRQLPDAPRARDHFFATQVGTKVYLAGGRRSGQTNTFAPTVPEVDVFDLTTETWQTTSLPDNLPTQRAGAATVNFKGEVVVIGGEQANNSLAVPVVEALNPATGKWRRLADLINARHGTQAIVSGDGIHITSGSPKQGGGKMNNPEYYGNYNPTGTAITASTINGPNTASFTEAGTQTLNWTISGGNQGVFIRSIQLAGTGAANFSIPNLSAYNNKMIPAGGSISLEVNFLGSATAQFASLTINHGANQAFLVSISSVGSDPVPVTTDAWLEAECATLGANLQASANASASNGAFVLSPTGNDDAAQAANTMGFTFQVSEAGSYSMYALVRFPTTGDDSYFVRVNGGAWTVWNGALGTGSAFAWRQVHLNSSRTTPLVLNLVAGTNTVEFAKREDGAALDKVFVTKSGSLPTGLGGTATNCGTTPPPANQAPTANAGADVVLTLPASSTLLNGSGNDADGTVVSYAWTQVSGPNTAVLSNQSTPSATVSGLVQGVYSFQLEVTDDKGAKGTDQVTVTVNAEPVVSNTDFWLEAECATLGAGWQVNASASASNGFFVRTGTGNDDVAQAANTMSFTFQVSEAGNYNMYALVSFPTSSDDSYFVRVNGGAWTVWNNAIGTGSGFAWRQVHVNSSRTTPMILNLQVGTNTLEIARREDGTSLDKVFVTKTSSIPTGLGGTATNCGGSARQTDALDLIAEQPALQLNAYPNPVRGELFVETSAAADESVTLRLMSLTGQVLYEKVSIGTISDRLQVDGYARGIYLLEISTPREVVRKKLLFE